MIDNNEVFYKYGKLLLEWMHIINIVKLGVFIHYALDRRFPSNNDMKNSHKIIETWAHVHQEKYGNKFHKLEDALTKARDARNSLVHDVDKQYMLIEFVQHSMPSTPLFIKKGLHAIATKHKAISDGNERYFLQMIEDYASDNSPPPTDPASEILRLIKYYEPPIMAVRPLLIDYVKFVNEMKAEL